MRVRLQYGRDGLDVDIQAPHVTLIEPRFVPGPVLPEGPQTIPYVSPGALRP